MRLPSILPSGLLLLLSATACAQPTHAPTETGDPSPSAVQDQAALVARGARLVGIGGCGDCHTPMEFDPAIGMPVPDRSRLLSGHPEGAAAPASSVAVGDQGAIGATFTSFRLPFGVVYAANLTPDDETGIGRWSEDEFLRAMRSGQHRGDAAARPILPPMPWMNLAGQSDDDLRAIFAYLQSVPALHNEVPAPEVPAEAMADIRRSYEKALAQMAAAHGPSAAAR